MTWNDGLGIGGSVVAVAVEGPWAFVVYVCASVARWRGGSKRPLQESNGLGLASRVMSMMLGQRDPCLGSLDEMSPGGFRRRKGVKAQAVCWYFNCNKGFISQSGHLKRCDYKQPADAIDG